MKETKYKLIITSLIGALIVSSVFLGLSLSQNLMPLFTSNNVQLRIDSLSISAYSYVYTDFPYDLQVEITNIDTKSLATGFSVIYYLNDTIIADVPWLALGSGNSITINKTWTPQATGSHTIKVKVVGTNVLLAVAVLETTFTVYNNSNNGYQSGAPFATYQTGIINGSLAYTLGNSSYVSSSTFKQNVSTYVQFNVTNLNLSGSVFLARLYVYYTWYKGVNPNPDLKLELNQTAGPPFTWTIVNLDVGYRDQKGFGSFNYPSGTLCYNVTSEISSISEIYIANITNLDMNSTSLYGAGLLIVTDDPIEPQMEYWINEGCDLISARYGAPENSPAYYPYATSSFIKPSLSDPITNATLTTIVPGGDGAQNKLIFNDMEFIGVYNASFAIDQRNVTNYITNSNNMVVKIVDCGYNGMTPTNAFLTVIH